MSNFGLKLGDGPFARKEWQRGSHQKTNWYKRTIQCMLSAEGKTTLIKFVFRTLLSESHKTR